MYPSQTPRPAYAAGPTFHPAPNAALLIDFDNVTMGIRSDLGKELKALLNSDVIKGKVAVQRAYADWRRYPQYIVPLAESSIDLIFAPAYGSSKKNATDLRMAIDAIELVFTRPEIGTYILLTGDSDFSSCVLKLKEYGKYVIGVGMRESSSDLLIQNCDEYYSYHSLSGLTRAGEVEHSQEDPWALVTRAVQQMLGQNDVMRTDRLKQVMLDLDPAFDEKKLGYSKFSRFVQDAAEKGLLRLRRTENGQHEVLSADAAEAASAAEAEASGNGRRGRGGRREERREPRPPREPRPEAPRAEAEQPEPEPEPEQPAPVAEPVAEAASAPAAVAPAAATAAAPERAGTPALQDAYALLQDAVRRLVGAGGKTVRDGDVKREMLRLAPGFDEEVLGFSKFTRFLRQAHDAEVIDLNRVNGGNYEVSLPAGGKRLPAPDTAVFGAAPEKRAEPRPAPAAEASPAEPAAPAAAAGAPEVEPEKREEPAAERGPARAEPAPAETRAAPAAVPTRGAGALRGRRGGRPGALEGPPPLLPGQVIAPTSPAAVAGAQPVQPEPEAQEAAAPQAGAQAEGGEADERGRGRSRRGRRGGRGRGRSAEAGEAAAEVASQPVAEAPAEAGPAAEPAASGEVRPEAAPERAEPAQPSTARARRGRGRGRAAQAEEAPPILPGQAVEAPATEAAPAAAERAPARGRARGGRKPAPAAPTTAFDAAALGLPGDRGAMETYLSTAYRGVGKKTADQLLDAFGEQVFQVLEEQPERVRELLGGRAGALLDQWGADVSRRRETAAPAAAEAPQPEASEPAAKPRSRGRRGGQARKKRETPTG